MQQVLSTNLDILFIQC